MIAGRGVVHSERFDRLRTLGGTLHMLQILLALPDGAEETEPSFVHVHGDRMPETREAGARIRRLADTDDAANDAVTFPAPMFVHDVRLEEGGRYRPPAGQAERAVYVLSGAVAAGAERVGSQQTALLSEGTDIEMAAVAPSRLLAFGGAPVGPRYMWWNFIHSSLDVLEAAKAAWRAGDTKLPPGDTESFTPAPPDDGRPLHRLNAG